MRQYAAGRSESAFAEVVSRHTNLVYSVALRRVGNAQLAEEITQAVFIILAQKAASLRDGTILSGWLYRTTCYVAGHALKQEHRRQRREQEACMESLSNQTESEVSPQMMPLLEPAMLRLSQTDRDALVLRYFEGRSLREVAGALGVSEAAAKMRLNRALEKMRTYFSRCGVVSSTAAIAGVISVHSVQAAPVMLAKTITAVALAQCTPASASTLTLIKGALKIMAWSKIKTATVTAVVIILAAGTTVVVRREINDSPRRVEKSAFTNAGRRTPETTMQTMLWAMMEGDSDAYLACCTPEERARRETMWMGRSKEELSAKSKQELASVTGVRILDSTNVSANERVLTARLEGTGNTQTMQFNKVGNEWRFAGEVH